MKRRNKCVNKKAYSHFSEAIRAAEIGYKYRQVDLGIYECPACLDFHLTSKYCNTQQYHKTWLIQLNKQIEYEFNRVMRYRKELLGIAKPQKPKQPPKIKTILEIKKQGESMGEIKRRKSVNTLEQSKLKEVFSTFEPRIYPQRKGWRESMRGIIIDTKKRFFVNS